MRPLGGDRTLPPVHRDRFVPCLAAGASLAWACLLALALLSERPALPGPPECGRGAAQCGAEELGASPGDHDGAGAQVWRRALEESAQLRGLHERDAAKRLRKDVRKLAGLHARLEHVPTPLAVPVAPVTPRSGDVPTPAEMPARGPPPLLC